MLPLFLSVIGPRSTRGCVQRPATLVHAGPARRRRVPAAGRSPPASSASSSPAPSSCSPPRRSGGKTHPVAVARAPQPRLEPHDFDAARQLLRRRPRHRDLDAADHAYHHSTGISNIQGLIASRSSRPGRPACSPASARSATPCCCCRGGELRRRPGHAYWARATCSTRNAGVAWTRIASGARTAPHRAQRRA